MKRLGILGLAAILVAALAMPAAALENVFGGYWDTRAWTQQNFDGQDKTEATDITAVETRTRIYYTAILNDDLKLVNKFEMDAVWGDQRYGDIGADGIAVEVKNSYADFNLNQFNCKLGVQGAVLGRGLLFDADFAGAVVTYQGEGMAFPFIWIKPYEGGQGFNKMDVDYYAIAPSFSPNEMVTINPYVLYATSDDASAWGQTSAYEDLGIYYVGLDIGLKMDKASIDFTAIYQGGDADVKGTKPVVTHDFSAWLADIKGSFNLDDDGKYELHGEVFYATGDEKPGDNDMEKFFVPDGQSYYWAEIMGYGDLGDRNYGQVSAGSPADFIGDIQAINLGATISPADNLSIKADVWRAALVEDNANNENELGTEVDLCITYTVVESLKVKLIGAYLFAGDATYKGKDDANPYEVGTVFTLSF